MKLDQIRKQISEAKTEYDRAMLGAELNQRLDTVEDYIKWTKQHKSKTDYANEIRLFKLYEEGGL